MTRPTRFMLSCALCVALASCADTPAVRSAGADGPPRTAAPLDEDQSIEPVLPGKPADAEDFDPASITKEVFDSTKNDVQALIEKINAIIRDKDFTAWISYLGNDYRDGLSDPAFLKRVSESKVLQKQKVELRNLGDYFEHVVVPSRMKGRVDDIEFIGQNRVKAFTVNGKGQRLRLYDLEKTIDGWKVVN